MPDKVRKYQGKQIDNIRHPLTDNPLIEEYIEICEKMFQETNRGELAYTHGEIELPKNVIVPLSLRATEIENILIRSQVRRNDPCICGSGLKYKKCCGKY